jgi:hypothetical protein
MGGISVASLVELTSAPRHGYVRELVAEHDARLGEMHVLLVLRELR